MGNLCLNIRKCSSLQLTNTLTGEVIDIGLLQSHKHRITVNAPTHYRVRRINENADASETSETALSSPQDATKPPVVDPIFGFDARDESSVLDPIFGLGLG